MNLNRPIVRIGFSRIKFMFAAHWVSGINCLGLRITHKHSPQGFCSPSQTVRNSAFFLLLQTFHHLVWKSCKKETNYRPKKHSKGFLKKNIRMERGIPASECQGLKVRVNFPRSVYSDLIQSWEFETMYLSQVTEK